MQKYSLTDETYNIHNSEHYKVSLQILPDSFSYVVLDSVRKKYIILKHILISEKENLYDELCKLFESEELLSAPLQSFRTFVFTEKTTLIPSAFSLKEKTSQLLSFNYGENTNLIFQNCSTPFDATLAYSIPSEIIELLNKNKCSAIYPHALTLLSETHKICQQKDKQTGMVISILNNYAEIAIIENSKLLLFNSFPFKTVDDFSYYLVYLFDLFHFDKEKTPITISGITDKNDTRISAIEKFIKNTQYTKANSQHIYSYRFNEIPQHHFSNLFVLPYEDYKR